MAISDRERELLHDFINDNWFRLANRYGPDLVGIEATQNGVPMTLMNSAGALTVNEDRAESVRPVAGDPSDPDRWTYLPL